MFAPKDDELRALSTRILPQHIVVTGQQRAQTALGIAVRDTSRLVTQTVRSNNGDPRSRGNFAHLVAQACRRRYRGCAKRAGESYTDRQSDRVVAPPV